MTTPLSVFQHTPTGHVPAFLSPAATETAWAFHHTLPDYAPTPLVPLRGWAQAMGVKAVFVKDESPRFGLNAFKGLGGIYALARAAGQVLGLPEDHGEAVRAMNYLKAQKDVTVEEVPDYHG